MIMNKFFERLEFTHIFDFREKNSTFVLYRYKKYVYCHPPPLKINLAITV